MPSSLKNYPCESCDYIGVNRRMLARHVAITHSKKVFKCPLCPFVTRYAANWYRHKRHIHGLSKVPTCEVCGFFANSSLELTQHKVQHQEEHNAFENGYSREEQKIETRIDPYLFQLSPIPRTVEADKNVAFQNINGNQSFSSSYNDVSAENGPLNDSVTFSLPLDGQLLENDLTPPASTEVHGKAGRNESSLAMNSFTSNTNLKPLKIRRSYCCDLCGYLTGSPREFLYHQRDIHGMRMNIFECELCIYASKHIQKLQRHYGLVHRQKAVLEDKSSTLVKNSVESKTAAMKNKELSIASSNSAFVPYNQEAPPAAIAKAPRVRKEKPGLLQCSACTYHTRNKVLMAHHEKTVHFKKKFFRCGQCGYTTNEKTRYTKHVKYHNLSKMQCEFCHFKSAYKWNMERHMRNHMTGTNGEYNCTLCNFVTHSKQSLKFHASNHHELEGEYDDSQEIEEEEEEEEREVTSDKSGQMVASSADWMNSGADEFENADSSNMDFGSVESTNMAWDVPQENLPTLHCTLCKFTTTWPFELKKHEEMHKSDKKHACPMCGMRFEHIAWLTKHLHRVHSENSEAQNLAAAYELMKPTRRRPAAQKHVPSRTTSTPKPILPKARRPSSPKQSLLSSYLKNPAVPKFSYSPPKEDMLTKALKQQEPQFSFPVSSATASSPLKRKTMRHVNSCNKCEYKTKWGSELQRHMRVHTDEKPFHCPRCSYHSKWKGDLTRHIAKYHGCKLPISNKTIPVPKLRLKKAVPNRTLSPNSWENVSEETEVNKGATPKVQDELPLDLTISKTNIFQPAFSRMNGVRPDSAAKGRKESSSDQNTSNPSPNSSYLNMLLTSDKFGAKLNAYPRLAKSEQKPASTKKKYFCPFCNFSTSTPSRFHIHIVQHYNRRPFMCSVCGHNSNWEWDITKHIRLKGVKDKEHRNACVLLTDETGRRNYEKYEKYLKVVKAKPLPKTKSPARTTVTSAKATVASPRTTMTSMKTQEEWKDNKTVPNYTSPQAEAVVSEVAPENIIVTPDLPFSQDMTEKIDAPEKSLNSSDPNWNESNADAQNGTFKFFLCKHCNYKHPQKKVVISHLTVHAGVRPFRCRVCGLTSCWRNVIVQHVKTAHNGYMNDVEDRITYIQEGFVIRITSVKSNNKYSAPSSVSRKAMFNCKFCPYNCDKEVYIKFHMKQHKPKDGAIYQCTHCPYYVKFKRTLVRHMKLHEAVETPTANETFPDPEEISEMSTPMERNDIPYPVPDYSYQQKETQQEYAEEDSIRIAYDQLRSADCTPEDSADFMPESFLDPQTSKRKRNKTKKHMCENCPYRTDNRTQYLYHKQFHRPNASARFKCNMCTYWATMQHLLTQHMKVHSREDNFYEDDETMYSYLPNQQYSQLADIMPVRVQKDGEVVEMFKCRHCPMMSKKKANVKIHERSHGRGLNDGQYACNFCSYKSTGQGGLTNHLKMYHSGEQAHMNNFNNDSNGFVSDSAPAVRKKVFSYFCMRCPAVFKSSSDLFIHKTFHGSSLPFPCPHCDYRAKHRIHLQKHLQVHTDAYISKRDASFGPPVHNDNDQELDSLDHGAKSVNPISTKKIDQMLLLELAEVKTFLRNSKIKGRQQKCLFCPAAFSKTAILVYHLSLHGSSGEFGCSQCDYATTRSANLAAHVQVHGKITSPTKRLTRIFSCPNCPAVFDKSDRFERHLNLHGQKHRFSCEHCDYSVNCAANLVKHRAVHEKAEPAIASGSDQESDDVIPPSTAGPSTEPSTTAESILELDALNKDKLRSPENADDKKAYVCERCPYFQMRKDAVINHQNRHGQKEGLQCPYCDYKVIGLTFLQNHVKSHITPTNVFSAQIYAKFNKFEVSFTGEDGNKVMLFEDKGTEVNIRDRFFPALNDDSLLNSPVESFDETIEESHNPISIDETTDNVPTKDNLTTEDCPETTDINPISTDSNSTVPIKKSGISADSGKISIIDDNSQTCFIISNDKDIPEKYLPKVILRDIFFDKEFTDLQLANLVIKKSCKTYSRSHQVKTVNKFSEKKNKSKFKSYSTSSYSQAGGSTASTSTKSAKSGIKIKIRVENVNKDNSEKSLYSIFTKKTNQVKIASGSQVKSAPGSQVKSAPGSLVKSAPGSLVKSASGSLVKSASGSLVKSAPGSLVKSAPGSLVKSAPGSLVKSASGSLVKIASGSLVKIASGSLVKSASGSLVKSASGSQVRSNESLSKVPTHTISRILEQVTEVDSETSKSSNFNGVKHSEENTMDLQTDDIAYMTDHSDTKYISVVADNTETCDSVFSKSDGCSFPAFHEPLEKQNLSIGAEETHPPDILKQLNSMVNGVCTNPP